MSSCASTVKAGSTNRSDTDFKVELIDLAGMKREPHLNHQPFGQMPYLIDQETGIEVYESRAIIKCPYLSLSPSLPLSLSPSLPLSLSPSLLLSLNSSLLSRVLHSYCMTPTEADSNPDAAAKAKSPLLPPINDLKAYAAFETACSFEQADFDGPASTIWFEMVGKKMYASTFCKQPLLSL